MKIKDLMIIPKRIYTLVRVTQITPISRNTVSKRAVVEAGAVLAKPLVCSNSNLICSLIPFLIGRVAAGAIAEKYLKLAYGIEIVAFVSSVGKVHLPANVAPPSLTPLNNDGNDVEEDALSEDFVALLANITREQVDKHPTKCPHSETAERMTEVRLKNLCAKTHIFRLLFIALLNDSVLFAQKKLKTLSEALSLASFETSPPA